MKMEYQVGFLLSRAAWAMNNFVNRILRENGLPDISVAYFAVLQTLWENDGLSISELGEKVQLEKSTMTSLIDRMEGAGLLRREDHPTDRRAFKICLTARGKDLEEKLDQVSSRAYRLLTQGIPEKDLQKSIEICKQLVQNAELGRGGE
ncbi:MAG: MarR family transcriptional regulator [Deltaproteobacteria bacterium]|nr:MarR family transcriptional regulator [Deltaproteobacteria bacterium]